MNVESLVEKKTIVRKVLKSQVLGSIPLLLVFKQNKISSHLDYINSKKKLFENSIFLKLFSYYYKHINT